MRYASSGEVQDAAVELYAVSLELHALGGSSFGPTKEQFVQSVQKVPTRALEDSFQNVFEVTKELAAGPLEAVPPSPHPLTRKADALARTPDRPELCSAQETDKAGCVEAESWLLKSLELCETTTQPLSDKERPSSILFDEAGEPFAFRKGNGLPTALTWREAYLQTGQGRVYIPAGAWLEVNYCRGEDPVRMPVVRRRGVSLLSLAEAEPPASVRLLRFSSDVLGPTIMQAVLPYAFELPRRSILHPYADAAVVFQLAGLEQRAHDLLQAGKAVEMAQLKAS